MAGRNGDEEAGDGAFFVGGGEVGLFSEALEERDVVWEGRGDKEGVGVGREWGAPILFGGREGWCLLFDA